MTRPYFSVVIPTKNRSFLIGHAIQSVLKQVCGDLEVIIADNDDDADATRKAVTGFDDKRIKYYRTGGLTMCDNWDFGYERAAGEYVMILEDRMALKLDALEKVHAALEHEAQSVVVWGLDFLNEVLSRQVISRYHGSGHLAVMGADEVLRRFLSVSRVKWFQILPLGHNSFVHRSVYAAIRSGKLGRVFAPVAPDFMSAFQVLNSVATVLHMGRALAVTGGSRFSHGGNFSLKRVMKAQMIKELSEDVHNELPLKGLTISSGVFNDYVGAGAALGGRLSAFPLSISHYFVAIWRDIEISCSCGVDMAAEKRAWKEALCVQDALVRRDVDREVSEGGLRRAMARLSLPQILNAMRDFPARLVFSDVSDYVNWEHKQGR